ncbi:50S ribosomal protein L31 [Candidatus Vidania fulgoroideae]|uniref:50S ribosomal protein L31 n=1 Tax=Candidatus Vidania fulgoroideorum TaxID=881286 RepID=A0AAX3NAE3_9PROT|nr:50S ribosomal protein L31 [Candidatus Vidania fulgoroideae]WDR79333.1 50S ribosomal protein L31 [Candidatus Vidania fulgoroideae]
MKNIHPKNNYVAFYDINSKKYIYTRSCIDIKKKNTIKYNNKIYYVIETDVSSYSHNFFKSTK